jgi:hypothetical protein
VKWNPSAVALVKPSVRFSIYPVPAKDQLTVEFTGSAMIKAEIYNLLGSRILQQDVTASQNQVRLNGLRAGLYVIKCFQDKMLIGSKPFIVD